MSEITYSDCVKQVLGCWMARAFSAEALAGIKSLELAQLKQDVPLEEKLAHLLDLEMTKLGNLYRAGVQPKDSPPRFSDEVDESEIVN